MKRLIAITAALLFTCQFTPDIQHTGHTILVRELGASDQQLTGTWNQWKYDSICDIKLGIRNIFICL